MKNSHEQLHYIITLLFINVYTICKANLLEKYWENPVIIVIKNANPWLSFPKTLSES